MEKIKARVNTRLLAKADRLFTGTVEGRVIEMLQNARRAGATKAEIRGLKAAIELEAFRHFHRQACHQLPYRDFLRAKELGIELAEATPAYDLGLLEGDTPEPVAVTMPEGFPLARCYRLSRALLDGDQHHAANAHLLGALGKPDGPFVPVRISECYDGYSWAKLATIERVDVAVGKSLGASTLGQAPLRHRVPCGMVSQRQACGGR